MNRNWETIQELKVAWTGGSSGEFKKQSDSGYTLKVKLNMLMA